MVSRRRRFTALAVAAVLVTAACGGDDDTAAPEPEPDAPAEEAPPEEEEAPPEEEEAPPEEEEAPPEEEDPAPATGQECTAEREGGSITIGSPADTPGLDPAQTTGAAAATGGIEMHALFDTLVRWNSEDGRYDPQLAESLEANAEGDVWTLALRPDVYFANGDLLDAEAVVASIQRLEGSTVSAASFLEVITSIDVVDDLTVQFTLEGPWGDFPYFLATNGGMIVNVAVSDEIDPDEFNLDPQGAGAGPYELARFAPGEEVVLTARDDYWGGVVCIKEVRIVSPGGDQANYDALQLGEVDLTVLTSDPRLIQRLQDEDYPGAGAIDAASQLMINTIPGQPGEDLRIRRALAAAINLDLIRDRIYDGAGAFASTIAAPGSPLYVEGTEGPAHDPDLARELVEEAKADGWDGRINLIFTETAGEESVLVEGMLQDVGMDPEVDLLSTPALVERVIREQDFTVTTWSLNVEQAAPWARLDTNLRSDSAVNRSAFADPRADEILLSLRGAVDLEDKAAAIADLQEVWNDQVPGVITRHIEEWVAWGPHVHGVKTTRKSTPMLDTAWIEQ